MTISASPSKAAPSGVTTERSNVRTPPSAAIYAATGSGSGSGSGSVSDSDSSLAA